MRGGTCLMLLRSVCEGGAGIGAVVFSFVGLNEPRRSRLLNILTGRRRGAIPLSCPPSGDACACRSVSEPACAGRGGVWVWD